MRESIKTDAVVEAPKVFGRMLGVEQLEIKVAGQLEARTDMTETEAIENVVRRKLGIRLMQVGDAEPKDRSISLVEEDCAISDFPCDSLVCPRNPDKPEALYPKLTR